MFGCAHKMFKCLHKEEFLGFSTCNNDLAYKTSTRCFFTRIWSVREVGFISKGAACQFPLCKNMIGWVTLQMGQQDSATPIAGQQKYRLQKKLAIVVFWQFLNSIHTCTHKRTHALGQSNANCVTLHVRTAGPVHWLESDPATLLWPWSFIDICWSSAA